MTLPSLTVKSARTRLMVTYLSIIMALSLSFSTVFYFQSVSEARGNLQNQQVQLRDYLFFTTPEGVQRIQDHQLVLFKRNLLKRLALLNFGMLALGAAVSYFLARQSLQPLEDALKSQSRFTSDAAHELRTPLTAMKAETEVALRARSISTADAKELLKSNLEEIAKLENLTSALLRLAKSSEKIDTSHWQACRVQEILKRAHERLADKAAARNITVKLPKTAQRVFGDSDQLVELFVTLLGNAIKYSHENSEVRIAVKSEGRRTCVKIIDQGIGIAEVDLPYIFERFYRADHSRNKTKADGYGLGLSLADAIVKAHGGEIKVRSTYGKGSTFTVVLPVT